MDRFFLIAAQVDPKTFEPAISTVTQTIIGSLLIISWGLAVLSIVQLIRVQNARVADQKAMNEASQELSKQMVKAFEEMKGALVGLKEAEEKGHEVTKAVHSAITNMSSRMDLLVMTVGGRRLTPPSLPKVSSREPNER